MNRYASRLTSLSELTGTFKSYDYLGLGTVVRRNHPQPAVDLTFLGTGPGSGGDQYVGLDSFGRVIDQNWKKGTSSTDRFTYTHDRNGNRLTKGNSVNTAFNESYSYDNLNQLTNFIRGSYAQSWDFDALGNFDSVTTAGTTQTRSHNKQNEITSVSGATSPTFDANGNMTKDETGKQYVYDAWNRIKIVKDSGGTTLKTYTYDALNHRVSETVGSNTTDLYYSAGWQVLEERVNGSGKYRYVWSPVYVDAMILRDRLDATERIWVQQDANFNVTAITDNSGVVLERYAYDSYGKVTVLNASWTAMSGSAYAWQYLHQGGRLDATSGLYYFRNRDYSPTLGRWATMDPIGYFADDANLFRIASNSIVNRTDPLGLADEPPFPAKQGEVSKPIDNKRATILERGGLIDPPSKDNILKDVEREEVGKLPKNKAPQGEGTNVVGGTHKFFGPVKPGQYAGSGGAVPCVGLILQEGPKVALFHFYADDSIKYTLSMYKWGETTKAILFGGNEEDVSRRALQEAVTYLRANKLKLTCVPNTESLYVNTDGDAYVLDKK